MKFDHWQFKCKSLYPWLLERKYYFYRISSEDLLSVTICLIKAFHTTTCYKHHSGLELLSINLFIIEIQPEVRDKEDIDKHYSQKLKHIQIDIHYQLKTDSVQLLYIHKQYGRGWERRN